MRYRDPTRQLLPSLAHPPILQSSLYSFVSLRSIMSMEVSSLFLSCACPKSNFKCPLQVHQLSIVVVIKIVDVDKLRVLPQMPDRWKGSWNTRFSLRSSLAWIISSCPNGSWCYEPSTKAHGRAIELLVRACILRRREARRWHRAPPLCPVCKSRL